MFLLLFVTLVISATYIYLNTNSGKRLVTTKVQSFLAQKLKTNFTIGSVNYHLPNEIILSKIYLPTPNNDSLLYANELTVSIALFKLIKGETEIKNIELKNVFVHISRKDNDSNFNFQFILDAFASNKKKEPYIKDTAELRLKLHRIVLNSVVMKLDDQYAGSSIYASVDSLEIKLKSFKPDKLQFDISSLDVDGVNFNSMITKHNIVEKDTLTPTNYLMLDAQKLNVKNVNISMSDKTSGFHSASQIQHLVINEAKVSLVKNNVDIDKIMLNNSFVEIITQPSVPSNTNNDTAKNDPWLVKVNEIYFDNNSFKMNNGKTRTKGFDVNNIYASELSLHTKNVFYTSDSTHALIEHLHVKEHSGFCIDTLHANVIYGVHQIDATELYVKTPHTIIQNSLQFSFDSLKTLTLHPEKSKVNFKLQNTVIDFDDVFLLLPNLKKNASIAKMEHKKVSINTMVIGTLQQLNIPVLDIVAFNGTTFHANAKLTNLTDTKELAFDIQVLPSRILKSDLSNFVTLEKRALEKLPAIFMLKGNAKGMLNDLVTNILINGSNFLLHAQAKLLNMNNPKNLHYDARIKAINIQKDLILAFVPKDKTPYNIDLPSTIQLTGTAIGDMSNINTNLQFDGSYGKVSAKGYVYNFNQANKATYDMNMTTQHFLIGKLIKQDTMLGAVTMHAVAKGKCFDINKMVSNLKADINQIEFNKYNYQSIHIDANLSNGVLQSTGFVNDPNLSMKYKAYSNSITKPTMLNLNLTLDTARLHALHLIEDSIDISTSLHLTSENLAMNNLRAMLKVDSVNVTINNRKVKLDSILINAYKVDENQILTVQSPIVVMNAKGNFEFDKLLPAAINFINRFYHLSDTLPHISNLQQISFNGTIYQHPLMLNLVPLLTKYDSIPFVGNFNSSSADSAFNFSLRAPYIAYNGNIINKASIDINTTADQLRIITMIDSASNAQTNLLNTTVKAIVSHHSVDLDLSTKNKNGNDQYVFGAFISVNNNAYTAQLKNKLILNNQNWSVKPTNRFYYNPAGFYVSDFIIATNQSTLNIQSEQNQEKSPIHVEIKNLSITDITSILNQDTLLASGLINGNFKVSEFDKPLPSFEGALQIDQLVVQQRKVGNLALATKKIDDNTIHANIKLSENENDINVDGNYFLNNTEKQIEADVTINKFNLATMEGFSNGNITNSSGSINGDIQIKGNFSKPVWNGKLHFKDPAFHLSKLGTTYKITNQTITLNYPNIELNKFNIVDSLNHNLILDGSVTSKSISDYVLNMDINAKDFMVVNTPRSTNEFIYGYAGVNANLNIKGSLTRPDIQGDLSLNDATDATIILPQQSENKEKNKSVVRFIDRDTFALPEAILFTTKDSTTTNVTSVLKYNVNVDLSKKAQLTVIIDPSTDDQLKVSGDAKFNVGVDPGGNILLVGNYDLVKGHYILHYQFLQRQFDLLPQSTILFSGNPLDAQLDIRAEYTAKTSAIDLVGNELGDADSKTVNTFNQKIPFKVLLFIKGTLKNLDISFDIKMPEENSGLSNTIVTTVENKLIQLRADPSAINKQVFSLLVLNRFVGEQSSDFFKGNGGGVEDIARESVSKFLSAALDQIASDLVKGIDIDVNLNSYKDYSSGAEQQRTDLNVGITKRFMDDRLSISLGKDFGVEGDDKSGKTRGSTNASYLPNAIVNYKLSKDGKYAVRAYSKNKFEVILDGYVVESGLSFLVTMDYEKFDELFGKKLQTK